MPLKSLELIGYKTFATKTTFEFSDSITAIVGPNGSGKSNIADSLRWVLGEQAYSLLRGRKTVDMIFSGSEGRPRAGMASVTVTFDNTDGWLPIDFSEVAITRRAYRDGQNEYLINNQRVRLRDVSELLGRSGLAERTYTIIGQGLVDAALSLKADERRKLFEEAAGIGVYRSRRTEALKRLDATRRNLERVQDILAELKPRLRSLDRQARRAAEHEQVKTDLHVLLREWYGFHWHRQQKELTQAREVARAQEVDLGEARNCQAGFDKQIRALRARIHHLRGVLNSWHRELGSLHNRRERLSRELAVTRERQRAFEERRLALRSEQTRLQEEYRLREERLARAEQEAERFTKLAAEAAGQNTEAQSRLKDQQLTVNRLASSMQSTEKTLSQTASEAAGLSARLEEIRDRLDFLAASETEIQSNLERASAAIREAQDRHDQASEALGAAGRQHERAAQQAADHSQQIIELETERGALLTEKNERRADLARMNARLEVLQQAERALAGYSAGSRLLLGARESGALSSALSVLIRRLEVRPEHEMAVAAALGRYLDAIVLPSDVEVNEALDLLLAEQANGALLPLDRITPERPAKAPDKRGGLSAISALVRCPFELRPAVDRLLGRFVLAQDRDAARALSGELPAGAAAVTLQGEVFEASGAIYAGGHGTASLISRSRQQREIDSRRAELLTRLAELDSQIETLGGDLQTVRSKQEAHRDVLEKAKAVEMEAEAEMRAAAAALEKYHSQFNWQESQLSTQRNERNRILGARAETHLSLEESRKKLAARREELLELRRTLRESSMDELQDQAAHWQTQIAVAERAMDDARARAEERRQALLEAQTRRQELDEQLKSLANEAGRLKGEGEKLKGEEGEIGDQLAAARERIDPAETELSDLESRQEAIQETETASRQALTKAERRYAQAQITLARKSESLESLRQRVEDDFGLVAFEYVAEIAGPNPLPLGSLVESLPLVDDVPAELGETIKRQRAQLRRMGAINPDARREHEEVRERFEFMTAQIEDLRAAETDILEAVSELDLLMEREFRRTFDRVAHEFRETFNRLFGGGSGRLVLTQPDDLTHTGVDIEARLPGRRTQGLSLLSGGERSLTATALVLSLIKVSPTPFCVLDEVDAMLDEANVNRFADLLRELSDRTQFIVITHNRNTVQAAETIYGITMGRDSTSQMLGLKLDEVADLV